MSVVLLNEGPPHDERSLDPVSLSIELVRSAMSLGRDRARLATLASIAARLRTVELAAVSSDGRRAFWLNVYNALDRHAIVHASLRGNLVTKLGLFSRYRYQIGAQSFSLDEIEHGLLRANRRPPTSLFRALSPSDPRLALAPTTADVRVHFALNCGARSCPPVRPFDEASVDAALERATRDYFESECSVDRARDALVLPFLLRLYRADFGDDRAMMDFAARHGSEEIRSWISLHSDREARVRFARYDWSIVE